MTTSRVSMRLLGAALLFAGVAATAGGCHLGHFRDDDDRGREGPVYGDRGYGDRGYGDRGRDIDREGRRGERDREERHREHDRD